MAYNRVSNRIKDDAEQLLVINSGGLSFNELYQRLDRKYGNGRTLNRRFLGKVVGELFKANKLQTYMLDGQKILQLK